MTTPDKELKAAREELTTQQRETQQRGGVLRGAENWWAVQRKRNGFRHMLEELVRGT